MRGGDGLANVNLMWHRIGTARMFCPGCEKVRTFAVSVTISDGEEITRASCQHPVVKALTANAMNIICGTALTNETQLAVATTRARANWTAHVRRAIMQSS